MWKRRKEYLKFKHNMGCVWAGIKVGLKYPYYWPFVFCAIILCIEDLIRRHHKDLSFKSDKIGIALFRLYRKFLPKKYHVLFIYPECEDITEIPLSEKELEHVVKMTDTLQKLWIIQLESQGIKRKRMI